MKLIDKTCTLNTIELQNVYLKIYEYKHILNLYIYKYYDKEPKFKLKWFN